MTNSKKKATQKKLRISEANEEFWSSPDPSLFSQEIVSLIRNVSTKTLENERWRGCGPPFLKVRGRILYRKGDLVTWLEGSQSVNSTSEL